MKVILSNQENNTYLILECHSVQIINANYINLLDFLDEVIAELYTDDIYIHYKGSVYKDMTITLT